MIKSNLKKKTCVNVEGKKGDDDNDDVFVSSSRIDRKSVRFSSDSSTSHMDKSLEVIDSIFDDDEYKLNSCLDNQSSRQAIEQPSIDKLLSIDCNNNCLINDMVALNTFYPDSNVTLLNYMAKKKAQPLPCLIDYPSEKTLKNNKEPPKPRQNQQKDWYKRVYNELHRYPKIEENNPYKPTYRFPSNKNDKLYNCLLDDDDNDEQTDCKSSCNKNNFEFRYCKMSEQKKKQEQHELVSIVNQRNSKTSALGDSDNDIYRLVQNGGDIPINGLSKYLNDKSTLNNTSKGENDSLKGRRKNSHQESNFNEPKVSLLCKAIAIYSFKSDSEKKGDIVLVHKKINDKWYLGEHNGFIGLFPREFVQFLTSTLEAKYTMRQLKAILLSMEGLAKAKHNFSPQTSEELEIRKGDLISIVRKVDSNWYEGYVDNREGIFPIRYVDTIRKPLDLNKLDMFKEETNDFVYQNVHRKQNEHRLSDFISTFKPELYVVKYNFEPEQFDEIVLRKGDLMLVYKVCDDGWSIGLSTRTGHFGSFPFNYCQKY